MKDRIKKLMTVMMSLVVCAGFFAGCGGSESSIDSSELDALRQQIAELQS